MKTAAVIGTAFGNIGSDLQKECEKLGYFLAKKKMRIITGACPGIPYFVGRGAITINGEVIGYSPAISMEQHLKKYNFTLDGCSKIEYMSKEYEINEVFLIRSIDMLREADVVISIEGGRGTYGELQMSLCMGKKLICCVAYGGISQKIKALSRFAAEYNFGGEIYIVKSIQDAIKLLEKWEEMK